VLAGGPEGPGVGVVGGGGGESVSDLVSENFLIFEFPGNLIENLTFFPNFDFGSVP
jgi:hypothetical protein